MDTIPTTVLRVNHHPPGHMAERYPYAAYGSNLSLEQMANRCPGSEIVVAGKIPGHRLAFATYATIAPDPKASVPVGIYKMTAADIGSMDRAEGLGRSYDRYLITALTDDQRAIRCFTYLKIDDTPRAPTDRYYERVAMGYRDWSFDDRRLRHARKEALEHVARKIDDVMRASPRLPPRKTARKDHETTTSLVTGRPILAPRFMTVRRDRVEWGARAGEIFFRVKGERVWYRDVSDDNAIGCGLARGEIARNLPGSSAYIPRDMQ